MAAIGVRRDKAALSSGCKTHQATAPAGSNRSSHGGNEVATLMRFARGDVRDHIVLHKSDHGPSYRP
jgi:hypothetical protein